MEGDEETVVRVRGLPWSASVDDVLKFFGELDQSIWIDVLVFLSVTVRQYLFWLISMKFFISIALY